MVFVVLPAITWFGNLFLPQRLHPVVLYIAVALVCYVVLTVSILSEFSGYEQELMEFDLNGNGDIDNSEQTPAAMELQDKIASDTGRMLGPIFAFPIAGIWVGISFAVLYTLEYVVKR